MLTVSVADEAFETAVGMERVGREFYEALALGCDDERVRLFCVQAARDEGRHLDAFREMQRQWDRRNGAVPVSPETAARLQAMVKSRVLPDPNVVRRVAMGGKLGDALRMAIQMERDSVSFYQGLARELPHLGEPLRAIITEEGRHLQALTVLGEPG